MNVHRMKIDKIRRCYSSYTILQLRGGIHELLAALAARVDIFATFLYILTVASINNILSNFDTVL